MVRRSRPVCSVNGGAGGRAGISQRINTAMTILLTRLRPSIAERLMHHGQQQRESRRQRCFAGGISVNL